MKRAWQVTMEKLVGPPSFGEGLPGSILLVPRRRGSTLLFTLLRYFPVRKAIDTDVIDERGTFAGEAIQLPAHVRQIVDFEDGSCLAPLGNGTFALPPKSGRLLLEIPNYFNE